MAEPPKRPWTGDGKPLKNRSGSLPETARHGSKALGNEAVGSKMTQSESPFRFFDWRFLLVLSTAIFAALWFTPVVIVFPQALQHVVDGTAASPSSLIIGSFTFFPLLILLFGAPIYGPVFGVTLALSLPLRWLAYAFFRVWGYASPKLVFMTAVLLGGAVFCAQFATAVMFWEHARVITAEGLERGLWNNHVFFFMTLCCAAVAGWVGHDA